MEESKKQKRRNASPVTRQEPTDFKSIQGLQKKGKTDKRQAIEAFFQKRGMKLQPEEAQILIQVADFLQDNNVQSTGDINDRIKTLPTKTQTLIYNALRVADQKQLDFIMNNLRDMKNLSDDDKKRFMTEIRKLDGVFKLKKISKAEQAKQLLSGYSKALQSQLVFKK